MVKYFCSKCYNLTFSLRYMTGGTWLKPRTKPQYCKICDTIKPQKDCLAGLKDLIKVRG